MGPDSGVWRWPRRRAAAIVPGPRAAARLIDAAGGAVGDLIAGIAFTGARPGDLRNAWLFTRDDGKPWGHSEWDELVRAAAGKAGLPAGVCLYTLRHSFITQVLMGGMSTLDVARITGTSLAMIEKHYGHLVMKEARERLDRVNPL